LLHCLLPEESHLARRGLDDHPFRGGMFVRVGRPFRACSVVVNWGLLDPRGGPGFEQENARGGMKTDPEELPRLTVWLGNRSD